MSPWRVALASLLALSALMALAAVPASASPRPYKSQLTEANGTTLQSPMGLTVDGSDNLWVSDPGSHLVSKFSSSGSYEAQNDGSGSWGSSPYIEGAAYSAAAGEVFVSDSNADDLWGLEPSAAYSSTDLNSGLGGGCCYIRVAADNSGGATGGDLYVSTESSVVRIDGSGAAADFTSSEPYVSGNELTGPFSSAGAVAVDPNGDLYVASGTAVYIFEPSGTKVGEITEFEGSSLGSITAIAIDPSNENIVVAEHGAIEEFDSSGESLQKITEANGGAFSSIQGLAVDSSGTLYAADGANGAVDVFGPVPAPARPYKSQLTEANGTTLQSPMGLTVDGSDNLWVSDPGSHLVSKFSSSGSYEAQNDGSGSWGSSPYIEGAAYSAAAGKVFVSDSNADDLWGLTPADASYSGTDLNSGLGGGCCYIRVAADNSGGATGGDLYVSTESSVVRIDGSGAAADFTSSEPYVSGNELTGPFSSAGAVAVDPNGDLYVASGTAVYIFEPSGTKVGEITEFEGSSLGSITAIAIDPSNENIVVAEHGAIEEFDSSGESLQKITEANGGAFSSIQGLAVDSSGTLYAADGANGAVDVFGPAPALTEAKFALEVTVVGSGGIASSPPGVNCSTGTCTHEFKEGKAVTLTANPSPHQHFVAWSGVDAGSCTSLTAPTCELTMSAPRSITAEFAPNMRTLTVTPTGPGSVSAASGEISACEESGGVCVGEYQEGSTVTLLANPGIHHHVVWGAGECTAEPSADECEIELPPRSTSVQVSFPINLHHLTIDHTGLGSVDASEGPIANCSAAAGVCTGLYDEASTVVLTATPEAHKHVVWGNGSCEAERGPGNDECEIEIGTADRVVEVSFPANKHLLTLTPVGQGSVRTNSGAIKHCTSGGGSCTGEYLEAATVTLLASPGVHQEVSWSGCTETQGNVCRVTIGAVDATVEANFSEITHTVSVTKHGSGDGTVTADRGAIVCGSICSAVYPETGIVTLTAAPAAHSRFDGWSGAGCSGTGPCVVSAEADQTVAATFSQVTHSLTIKSIGSGSGSVSCDGGACESSYPEGAAVTITAAADRGSRFAGFAGAGCPSGATCVVRMSADTALTATFDAKPARCRKGFVKRHGKCVKRHHHRRHHKRHHRRHSR